MLTVAKMCVEYQVNLILICFDPKPQEIQIAEYLQDQIKELSSDQAVPVEVYLRYDPSPAEIESIMVKKVANLKIPESAPLITETFM